MTIYDIDEQIKLDESNNRYSVEVNYRTHMDEVLDGFAKLVLGFVSAALKDKGYHVKKVFDKHPFRIIASANNWKDGEWVLAVSYNPNLKCFVASKGFYNKDRDTMTIQSNHKCEGESASEVFRDIFNRMNEIKDKPPHHVGDLKGIKKKTGPIQGRTRPAQKYFQNKPEGDDRMGM